MKYGKITILSIILAAIIGISLIINNIPFNQQMGYFAIAIISVNSIRIVENIYINKENKDNI